METSGDVAWMGEWGPMKVYRERVSWPLWFHIVMGGAVLGSLAGALPIKAGLWRLVPLAVGVTLAVVWWGMRYLHLELGPEGAAFGFGGPRRTVARDRISSAEPEDYSVARYMGWGYRIGWTKGDRAYSVLGHRRGVRLKYTDEGGKEWSVFVSCCDPGAAVEALESKP
ncbi:MAG: hypothetical protein ACYTGV_15700 [Planctomycetota bacterium]|jgi:hypothetical protein